MADSSADRDPLDRLAEEFVARLRAGEHPAIADYADRHPDLADDIRDLFPALVEMEHLKPAAGELTGAFAPAAAPGDPARVGEFRILRRVGSGGMGVVYEAVQESLGRHVALKLLPAEALVDPKRLERFKREAKAAARLHHTNIVPVFGTGEADGRHFYAMQFIAGHPLDAVIGEVRRLKAKSAALPAAPRPVTEVAAALVSGTFARPGPSAAAVPTLTPDPVGAATRTHAGPPVPPPTPAPPSVPLSGSISEGGRHYWTTVAGLGAQVADALAYAHAQGVLHRDIKPANLLLDLQGTVWVTDFGLAKSSDADDLTRAGDVIGTLRYMAPERFEGAGDHRADVYALGLTLYELLTLTPAFAAENRAKLVEQAVAATPPPRARNPAVPRDLETIVLKAIARDPALRYQSAGELADDLRRYTEDRPIRARRASPAEQAWRWCRRNPAVAFLLAAVGLLLTAGAVGGAVFNVRLSAALTQAEADRDAARTARREEQEKRLASLVAEARAGHLSRRVGQRFGTLRTLREAVELARQLDRPATTFDELRTLAVAALALPDVGPDAVWVTPPTDDARAWWFAGVDPSDTLAAFKTGRGDVSLRRLGTGPDDCGEVARFPGAGTEASLTWGPRGAHVAVQSGGGRLRVWRIAADRPVSALEVPAGCQGVTFDPAGRHLIAVVDTEVRTYDLTSGERVRTFPAPAGATGAVEVNPRRPELAAATAAGVVIQDPTDGRVLGRLGTAARPSGNVCWHPHGDLLAVVAGSDVEIWDVPARRRNYRLEHTGGGVIATFNGAGDLMCTGGWHKRVRLWNPYTGREVLVTAGDGYCRFRADDRLSGPPPDFQRATTFPLAAVAAGREYRTLAAGTGVVRPKSFGGCSFHPAGRLFAVGTGEGLSLMDLATGAERAFIPTRVTAGPLFEADGHLLAGTAAALVRWPVRADPADPSRVRVGPPEPVPLTPRLSQLGRSADGTLLAATEQTRAVVWPPARPGVAVVVGPHADCRYVAVHPTGALVATGSHSAGEIKVWDPATGRPVRTLQPGSRQSYPAFSADGRWLFDHTGESWRTADWTGGPRHPGGVMAVSPAGGLVAWGDKGVIVLTDPETGREFVRLGDPHQDGFFRLTFSPDGALLAGGTNDSLCVRVWDLRAIRAGLAELGLDWDAPAYPPAPAAPAGPLTVEVVGAAAAAPKP